MTLYFSKNVLFPSSVRQPGQFHFACGIKFDSFGVSSSIANNNGFYGQPDVILVLSLIYQWCKFYDTLSTSATPFIGGYYVQYFEFDC